MAAALRSLLGRPPLTSRFRRLLHDAPADQKVANAKMKKLQDEQQDWDAMVRMMVGSKLHSDKVVQDRDDPPWASRAFRVLLIIGASFICGCNLGERIYHKLGLRTNRP